MISHLIPIFPNHSSKCIFTHELEVVLIIVAGEGLKEIGLRGRKACRNHHKMKSWMILLRNHRKNVVEGDQKAPKISKSK